MRIGMDRSPIVTRMNDSLDRHFKIPLTRIPQRVKQKPIGRMRNTFKKRLEQTNRPEKSKRKLLHDKTTLAKVLARQEFYKGSLEEKYQRMRLGEIARELLILVEILTKGRVLHFSI